MNYYIITGTSRGIGEALARNLIRKNSTLYCISRNGNDKLIRLAARGDMSLVYLKYDLAKEKNINACMDEIFTSLDREKAEKITLINNAGVLDPIGPIEKCPTADYINNYQVNLIAPVLLCRLFIRQTSELKIPKTIINISTGAAKKPYFGWSAYCSSKAGLDHFTRCIALEQSLSETPVKIISLAPGVVDTRMQEQIRDSCPEDFPDREKFIRYAEKGELSEPDYVAKMIIRVLDKDLLDQGSISDIRELAELLDSRKFQ